MVAAQPGPTDSRRFGSFARRGGGTSMSAITANRQGGSAARHGAALDSASARRPSGPQGAQTSRGLPPAAAVVKRSETDQAALDRLKTAQDAVANATRSFDERLKLRSDA